MSLTVAILAGGLATRLGTIAASTPKVLVEVAGRPFAEHQLELLKSRGLTEVVFLVSHLGERVRETLGDGGRFGLRVRYLFDGPTRLGTGGAIRRAIPMLGDRFFVLYGDSYLDCDYAAVESAFLASGAPGLMTVFRNDDRWDRSNVVFENGRIAAYDKRRRTAGMRHIDYGLSAFRAGAFATWPDGGRFDLSDVYRELSARGELAAFEAGNRFYEIGSPAGLDETRAHLQQKGYTSA